MVSTPHEFNFDSERRFKKNLEFGRVLFDRLNDLESVLGDYYSTDEESLFYEPRVSLPCSLAPHGTHYSSFYNLEQERATAAVSLYEMLGQVSPGYDQPFHAVLMKMVDDFIAILIIEAVSFAKHRKSNIVQDQDLLLSLHRHGIYLAGFDTYRIQVSKDSKCNKLETYKVARKKIHELRHQSNDQTRKEKIRKKLMKKKIRKLKRQRRKLMMQIRELKKSHLLLKQGFQFRDWF